MVSTVINGHTGYYDHASMTLVVTPVTNRVIFGSGSLYMAKNSSSGQFWNVVRNTSPRRFQSGRMSGFLRLVTVPSGTNRAGFFFDASQEDLSAAAGTVYALVAEVDTGGIVTLKVSSSTTGISGLTNSLNTSTSTITLAALETMSLVVRWVYAASLGGLWVRGYFLKSATDLPAYTDATTPAVSWVIPLGSAPTSLGEGEFVRAGSIFDGATSFTFDRVNRTPVTVGVA